MFRFSYNNNMHKNHIKIDAQITAQLLNIAILYLPDLKNILLDKNIIGLVRYGYLTFWLVLEKVWWSITGIGRDQKVI